MTPSHMIDFFIDLLSCISHVVKSVKIVGAKVINRTRFDEWYYHDNGTLKGINETVKRPHYANVLQKIARDGPNAFYKGEVAAEIVDAVSF